MSQVKTKRNDLHILDPIGRLDAKKSSYLGQQLENEVENGIHFIILNCHELDYISSAGFRLLIMLAKKLAKTNGSLILCCLEDYLLEVFEISGLDNFISIVGNLEDALRHLPN